MPSTNFQTRLSTIGNNTGIVVPSSNIAALGSAKRPAVHIVINDYEYDSSIGSMNGQAMISFSKAHREASGIAGGDTINVTLSLIEGVRDVAVPLELADALRRTGLTATFDGLAYSKRKEFVRQVSDAKTAETSKRRIDKIIISLQTV